MVGAEAAGPGHRSCGRERPDGVWHRGMTSRGKEAIADDQQADAHLGEVVLDRAVAAYRAALGSRLIAGYALGSLAHGGFSPLVSDVDLGLILDDPVRPEDRMAIDTVSRSVRAGGSALEQRLSVFWGTPATLRGQSRGGRFPPLDRLDLLEYGRL